ncbi:hypothetical protein ACFLY6_02340 [Candidatus Dependentiae bacterium]
MLVYYESTTDVNAALRREKSVKWKMELVESKNPTWTDLSATILSGKDPGSSPG